MEKILHHLGCPTCFFLNTSIKTFWGIPSGAGFFLSTVYISKPAASQLFRNQLKGAKLFVFSGTTSSGVKSIAEYRFMGRIRCRFTANINEWWMFMAFMYIGKYIMAIVNQPPRATYPPPRNKGLIAGLLRGNQWVFISPY